MGLHTSEDEVVRDMCVLRLGIGVWMTLFNIIVQNAFLPSGIGQVTAASSFFREIGGAIGLAIFASFMTSRFVEQFQQHLPATRNTRCFLIATLLIAVGFAATLFLREIPLRKRQKIDEMV